MKILVIHPGEDTSTIYTKYWLSKFIEQIQEDNDVLDIKIGEVNPEAVLNTIINENPDFIYSSGHGIPEISTISTINGSKDLFWTPTNYPGHEHNDSNVDILKDTLFYLLSCHCGAKLVPAIGGAGGIGAGYEDEFVFVIDSERYSVEEDIYGTSFGDCANQFAISTVEGKDLQTCLDETYNRYTSEVQSWNIWLNENPTAPSYQRIRAKLCADYLLSNRNILVGSQQEQQPKIASMGMLLLIGLLVLAIIYGAARKEKLEEGKIF